MTPAAATQTVLAGGLAIGLALGALAQATRFCTMGAIADWLGFGGRARAAMWALAVAVGAAGSMALVQAGWLDAARTVPWSERFLWLSYAVGGLVFGFGMVLASGCPQRNLVRLGAGSLKALVTLLVAALAAEMTLRGALALPRVNGLDATGLTLAHPQDLGHVLAAWTGLPDGVLRGALLALLLAAMALFVWRVRAEMDGWHWAGGLGVGLLLAAAWVLTGHAGFIAEHPETLEAAWMGTATRRPEGLSFAAPLAQGLQLLTLWSDRNTVATYGVMVALGVPLGSAVSALLRREFRIEGFADAGDLGRHLAGALLMGFGGVTAMGCSIGQGVTGLAMLSAGAVLAVAGIVLGAVAALRWQERQL